MDLKEIVDKLQNIDAKDLQNINWGDLFRNLTSRTDRIIMSAIIVFSVGASIYFLVSHKAKYQQLSENIRLAEEKLEVAEQNITLKKKYEVFLADFPEQATVEQIIDVLSAYALKDRLKILSYSPAQKEEKTFLTVSHFMISTTAETFDQILNFVKTIEESPYPLKIVSWSGEYFTEFSTSSNNQNRYRTNPNQNNQPEEKKEGIKAALTLSLIELKI